jgi:DNA invertase Pin-like site-specific DNA recombinase
MKQKAVIYVRVSNSEQNTDRQKLDLTNYSKELNLDVVKIFSEQISASKKGIEDRKEFNLMMQYIEQNQIKNVIISEVSRMSRKSIQTANFIHDCNNKQINICIHQGRLNSLHNDGTIDRTAQLIIAVLANISEQETATLGERIKSGKRSQALKGKSYHGQLYGYDKIEGRAVINEEEAIIVKKMFSMLLQGIGCRKIANYINENEKSKKIWSSASIHSVVTNPFFKGERYSSGIQIDVDPIISEQEFNEAQSFIKSRFRFVSDAKHTNPFASFIKCECGSTFTQVIIPKNRSNVYKCSANCGIPSINRPYLIDEIKTLLEDNAKLTQDKQVRTKLNLQIKANTATITKNKKRIDELQRMKKRNYHYLTSSKITEEDFDEAHLDYESEKTKLTEVNLKLYEINKSISHRLENEIEHYDDNLEIFKSQLLPILESIVIGEKYCSINMKGFSNTNGLSSTKGFSNMYFRIHRGSELQLYRNHLKKFGKTVEFKPSLKIEGLDTETQILLDNHLDPYYSN